ncbi:MAG: RNA 2',3'-cyclic phosphodiesterase [Gammaproteobacteria bacterium]|nr:RNA 2',3'-cyclic phosphodiesterase [Gammaproteobacteria bacterium]
MNLRRMFLTVWPNEVQVEQLYQLQGDYIGCGKEVSPENLHMTLLFMGDMRDDEVDCLIQAAQNLVVRPFIIHLDRLGYFPKKKIFYVAPSTVPDELTQLQRRLRSCAQHCGVQQLSKKYLPHVSLQRNSEIPLSNPSFSPIEWEIDEFHLVESRLDRRAVLYNSIESFSLINHS